MVKMLFPLLLFSSLWKPYASPENNRTFADVLLAKDLIPYGRTAVTQGQLELIGSAAHFGFSFEGTECRVFAAIGNRQERNYLQYELDGVYQKRIRITNEEREPLVIKANKEGKHTVWLFKATEAHTGPIFIQKVEGKNIKPIAPAPAPLIEFIGNSITCGAAADPSEVPCGQGAYHDQHNAYYAYGPRVARALGANFMLSSVSGIGVYRNWNNDGPAMPQVYDKTDFQLQNARPWDFTRYRPKVVSIALGTNDFSNGDGKSPRAPFDSSRYIDSYVQFIQHVRVKYPAAQIVLLSSAVMGGSNKITFEQCLTSVKNKTDALDPFARPIAVYFFRQIPARGCTGHPGVEDHALMAAELVPLFRRLLQEK